MRRDALGAGLIAVCLWGLAPVATRAVVGQLAPLPLLLIRLAAASLVLLPWAVPVFRALRPRSAGRLAAAGLCLVEGARLFEKAEVAFDSAAITRDFASVFESGFA